MEATERGAYREFTFETIFSDELTVPEQKIIWKTKPAVTKGLADPESEEMVQIASGGINIVSSRDARQNVRMSLGMGLDLAASGLRVLYINSYAGLGLLREGVQSALSALESRPDPKLFKILDCKMGMWEQCKYRIEEAVFRNKMVDYSRSLSTIEQYADVVILNSYEFASFTYKQKLSIATSFVDWFTQMPLTVVVFTQEAQAGLSAGLPFRGPLGILAATATTVSKTVRPQLPSGKVPKGKGVHENSPDRFIKYIYTEDGQLVETISRGMPSDRTWNKDKSGNPVPPLRLSETEGTP